MNSPKIAIPKINGFSRGINLYQIFSYFLVISKIFAFSYIILPNLLQVFQILSPLVYYISNFIVIICGYFTSTDDPTDEVVISEKKCRLAGVSFDGSKYEYQCDYCETNVSNNSKHCTVCNRCVQNFDHHCNWINNCIARKNYKTFLTMITSLAFSTFWFVLNGILLLIDYYTQKIGVIVDTTSLRENASRQWEVIVLIVFVVLMTGFFVLDMKLLVFHIRLIRNNMTTYEYIVKLRAAIDKPLKKKGMRKKNGKKKVTPISTPKTPDHLMDNEKGFDFELNEENKSLSSGKERKDNKININLQQEQARDNLEEEHNQTCDDLDGRYRKSIRSLTSTNEQFVAINVHNEPTSEEKNLLESVTPKTRPSKETLLKEMLNNVNQEKKQKSQSKKKSLKEANNNNQGIILGRSARSMSLAHKGISLTQPAEDYNQKKEEWNGLSSKSQHFIDGELKNEMGKKHREIEKAR